MALCFCGHLAVTQTSWNDTNRGRMFLACPQINGYIDLVDPSSPMCQRELRIISSLLRVSNRMEADMMMLVQENINLKKSVMLVYGVVRYGTMCTWQRAVGGRSNVRLTKSWTPAPNSFFHRRGYVSRDCSVSWTGEPYTDVLGSGSGSGDGN
ncbi:hypothetical protein Tco_0377081 [Tanacetum coccineum]